MKVAIPTNDRINLAERSGRAKEFAIYEINNSEIVNITYKKNHHKHNDGDDHNHSHSDIVEEINECELFLAKKVGRYFAKDLKDANIKVKITQQNIIEESLKEIK